MDKHTIQKIIELNKKLYTDPNSKFSQSRNYYWKSFNKISEYIKEEDRVLDIGCGNGRLGEYLYNKFTRLEYVGIDFSEILLNDAKSKLEPFTNFELIQVDITDENWVRKLPVTKFDIITLLATLHHIPSFQLRTNVLKSIARLLKKTSYLIISNWQPEIKLIGKKIVQPDKFDITSEELEKNDYIIDWKSGFGGFRYIHIITNEEMHEYATNLGLTIQHTFRSEKNMNIYHILRVTDS